MDLAASNAPPGGNHYEYQFPIRSVPYGRLFIDSPHSPFRLHMFGRFVVD
jgi:hypothetical protein